MKKSSKAKHAAPLSFLIVGAGGRGFAYANLAKTIPEKARIVAVAEPRKFHREKMTKEFGIAPDMVFNTWQEAAATGRRLADCVAICTQDAMHEECVMGLARLGYHIILENRPELIVSGLDATLESHLVTFAAEESRRTGKTVNMLSLKEPKCQ